MLRHLRIIMRYCFRLANDTQCNLSEKRNPQSKANSVPMYRFLFLITCSYIYNLLPLYIYMYAIFISFACILIILY
jgi:hypothetical protein